MKGNPMFSKKTIDTTANKFGTAMGHLQDTGREIERIPEKFVKGTAKAAVKAPVSLAKGGADIGTGVLKELSSVVAYGAREATGAKKSTRPYKSNVAKGWFE